MNFKRGWVGLRPCPEDLNPLLGDLVVNLSSSPTTAAQAVAATETSGNSETFDCSSNNVLRIYVSEDGGSNYFLTESVTITGSDNEAVTAAEVVADLTDSDNVLINKYLTIEEDTGNVKITHKTLGPKGKFYVTGSANTPLGFTAVSDATAKVGTGTLSVVPLSVTTALGDPVPYAKVTATLYNASTDVVKHSTSQINRASTGMLSSGAHSNEAVIETDQNGNATIEIADSASGSSSNYLELSNTDADTTCAGMGRILNVDYKVSLNTSITTGSTVAAAATETSGSVETYNCSSNDTLQVHVSVDGGSTWLDSGEIDVSGGTASATTAAEVVSALNNAGDDVIDNHLVVEEDTGNVKITTNAVGPNASFYVDGTANTPIGFTGNAVGSTNDGTGTVASVPIVVTDAEGNVVSGAEITAMLYASSSGTTEDTTAQVNRLTTGTLDSGQYDTDVDITTDSSGEAVIEIGDTASGASDCYIEISKTDTGVACVGMGRTAVTTGT